MKRNFIILLALSFLLLMVSCGKKETKSSPQANLISQNSAIVAQNASEFVGSFEGMVGDDFMILDISSDGSAKFITEEGEFNEKLIKNSSGYYITDTQNNQILKVEASWQGLILYGNYPESTDFYFSKSNDY